MKAVAEILRFTFADGGSIPNNPRLPVLVYKHAAPPRWRGHELAEWFEGTWPDHGWEPAWRWGVYPFPHYHSTAHEVLGVYRGQATLRLGDRTGNSMVVAAGDLIVLPAGTAHQNLGCSPDFQVVGGYPHGQSADLLRGAPEERPAADIRIAAVPRPAGDPLFGPRGVLAKAWGL